MLFFLLHICRDMAMMRQWYDIAYLSILVCAMKKKLKWISTWEMAWFGFHCLDRVTWWLESSIFCFSIWIYFCVYFFLLLSDKNSSSSSLLSSMSSTTYGLCYFICVELRIHIINVSTKIFILKISVWESKFFWFQLFSDALCAFIFLAILFSLSRWLLFFYPNSPVLSTWTKT